MIFLQIKNTNGLVQKLNEYEHDQNINTLTKKQFQKQSTFVERTSINMQMQVLKDSNSHNQQRKKIVLKYKEATNSEIQSHDKILWERRNCSQSNKQNHNFMQDKKVKLTLKPFTPREGSRQNQVEGDKRFKQQKIKQVNPVSKPSTNHKQQIADQRTNQSKFNGYFKPSVIYFSLKSNQQNEKKSPQLSVQTNKDLNKQIRPKKNYQLAAFIGQFIHKLNLGSFMVSHHRFSYSQFVQILRSLFMIRYSSEAEYKIQVEDQKEELQKVYLLWRIFKVNIFTTQIPQSENRHYFLVNFILLFTAILKIHVETFEELNEIFIEKLNNRMEKQNDCERSSPNEQNILEPSHIFFIKNKKLLNLQPKVIFQGIPFIDFSDQVKSQLFKEFQIFRVNRLPAQNSLKTLKLESGNENSSQQFDFGSLLSPRSQQLAQTKRMKILQQIKKNGPVNVELKEKPNENKLNLFLSYKSPRSCQNKLFKDSQEVHTQRKKPQLLKQKQKKSKNDPPKIKYSQLNVVLNMQKGRKLKQQKQMILEKGWTNCGRDKDFHQKQNINPKSLPKPRIHPTSHQNSTKKPTPNSTQQQQINYFQLRKNSLRGMMILAQKLRHSQQKKAQQIIQEDQQFNDFQQLFLSDQHYTQETHRAIVEALDDISNSTITIKDNNECFDLEQQEQQQDYVSNNYGRDFVLQDAFDFESALGERSLVVATTIWKNARSDMQQNEKRRQQPLDDRLSSFKLKTFNTQQNQLPQEDSSSSLAAMKTKTTDRMGKQARVIKSYLKIPILYVDVNMDQGKKQRIIIYEEDNPSDLAIEFGHKHKLASPMIGKLEQMLKQQIGGILGRIDEEDDQYNQTKEEIGSE